MSKELAFTDDNDVVKYLDTTTALNLALTADGVAFDLTNAKSILVKIANDDGYIMQQTIDLTTVTSPLGGTLSFPINHDVMNTLVPDDYDIEVWVTMNDGTQAIFPSDGTLGFSIEENLMSDTGEVIPTINLNDFQQQFNDLSNQMENAVHNVQKGDKGDKGDTGTGLEIKDKVSSVSNLPSTANEGDGYLVGEELYVRVNGAWKDCGPLQGPKGDQGIQGNTGTGISSTTIQYQISSSATTAPTGIWSNNIIATTSINPYLWMKATLNYTDHTTKDFYLVSQKGDKGDTGPTGPTGPIGPQGPVGSGLVVKGTVKDASQLPKSGNQEGYCYFIGTDLYVWDAGAWKNCGSVSPDLSNYVTVTDLNNGLSTKVTDNKNGTEQLNGIQVQPFNKLSDTIGGRNLATNPGDVLVTPPVNGSWSSTVIGKVTPKFFEIINKETTHPITISFEINTPDDLTKTNLFDRVDIDGCAWGNDTAIGTNYFSVLGFKWLQIGNNVWKGTYALQYNQGSGVADSSRPNIILAQAASNKTPHNFTVLGNSLCLYWGTQATDWTPAPEDKVNVSDMRRPASDVAGIEEVSAKQDKIGYTPADDSKVVHSTDMRKPASDVVGLEDITTACNQGGIANRTDVHSITKEGLYQLNGSSLINFINSGQWWGTIQVINQGGAILQIARVAQGDIYTNSYAGSPAHWIGWTKLADDSKVAHLSGANNFDTVPTVNNNPLLLASSLPSDLARTTKDANFTEKLQKSGIDVATTTDVKNAVNTATANMVDSSKLTNFTAGLQSGGVNVATAADIKSVTDKAWCQLDNKYITNSADGKSFQEADKTSIVLYRIQEEIKNILFSFIIFTPVINAVSARIDFSSIVKNISFPSDYTFSLTSITSDNKTFQMSIVNNQIQTGTTPNSDYVCSTALNLQEKSSSEHEVGQCFVDYDELV